MILISNFYHTLQFTQKILSNHGTLYSRRSSQILISRENHTITYILTVQGPQIKKQTTLPPAEQRPKIFKTYFLICTSYNLWSPGNIEGNQYSGNLSTKTKNRAKNLIFQHCKISFCDFVYIGYNLCYSNTKAR